jgi:hypothetical protein
LIHIGTAHYRDDRWLELQLRWIERNTGEPYRTYASLDGLKPRDGEPFDVALDHTGVGRGLGTAATIEAKLDLLTARMVEDAEAGDPIVIVHGDTLPLPDWTPAMRALLEQHGFAGVKREEIGEPIPHWSFCATTAGLWSSLGSDWSHGPVHWDFAGHWVTDTGATLLEALEREGVPWKPLLRSNVVNLHPLWFALYGDLVYHHGAGFRPPMSRLDSKPYRDKPIGVRNAIGLGKRIANTRLAHRMYRRAQRDEGFYLELRGQGRR